MTQEKTQEKRTIGRCIWCRKPIYENQSWEEMYSGQQKMSHYHIRQGPIHETCRVPYLQVIILDLIGDIRGLEWMLEAHTKEKKTNKNKPLNHKIQNPNPSLMNVRRAIASNLSLGNNITQSRLIKHFTDEGFHKEDIDGHITNLKTIGDIFEPRPGLWKSIRPFKR